MPGERDVTDGADSISETASAGGAQARPREAMLYLPSLGLPGDGVELVARHLADAFSACSRATYKFVELTPTAAATAAQTPATGGLGRVFAVEPDDPQSAGVALDVHQLNYATRVLERYGRMSLLEKVLRVALESGWLASTLITSAFVVYRKTFWQRIQLVIVAASFVSLLVYFALLLEVIDAAVSKAVGAKQTTFLDRLTRLGGWIHTHWPVRKPPALGHAQLFFLDRMAWLAVLLVVAWTVARYLYTRPFAGPLRHGWHVLEFMAGRATASLRPHSAFDVRLLPFGLGLVLLVIDTAHNCPASQTGGACFVARIGGVFAPLAPLVPFGNAAAYRSLQVFYHATQWSATNAAYIAAVITAIGFSRKSLATGFETTITVVLAVVEYARVGYARSDAMGLFVDALTQLERATDADGKTKYSYVHVAGYSAGALVALDALFYARGIPQGCLDRVGDLVTIGPPISLAKQLVPGHFSMIVNRFSEPAKHQWINVCSPLDVFGSPVLDVPFELEDFPTLDGSSTWARRLRDSIRRERAEAAKQSGDPNNISFGRTRNVDFTGWYPVDLNMAEVLSLAALQAHEFYWSAAPGPQYTAFTRIAPLLADGRSYRKRPHEDGAARPPVRLATAHLRDGDAVPPCTAGFPSEPWDLKPRPARLLWDPLRLIGNGNGAASKTLMHLPLAYDASEIEENVETRHVILIPPDVARRRRRIDGDSRTSRTRLTERGWPFVEVEPPPNAKAGAVELLLWRSGGACPTHRFAPILHYHRIELRASPVAGEAGQGRLLGTFTIECQVNECIPADVPGVTPVTAGRAFPTPPE